MDNVTNSGTEVIKLFSCSTQQSMKFVLLINVKMPTIVGILHLWAGKNSILGLPEPKKPNFLILFYTYEHLKFHAQLSWAWNKFGNLGASFFYFLIYTLAYTISIIFLRASSSVNWHFLWHQSIIQNRNVHTWYCTVKMTNTKIELRHLHMLFKINSWSGRIQQEYVDGILESYVTREGLESITFLIAGVPQIIVEFLWE